MPQKLIIVIDKDKKILEQIDISGTNCREEHIAKTKIRQRYLGLDIDLEVCYGGLYPERTKKLIEDIKKVFVNLSI